MKQLLLGILLSRACQEAPSAKSTTSRTLIDSSHERRRNAGMPLEPEEEGPQRPHELRSIFLVGLKDMDLIGIRTMVGPRI